MRFEINSDLQVPGKRLGLEHRMMMMLMMTMMAGRGEAVNTEKEMDNRVAVKEGIFARKIGDVAMISHYDRINVILRIPEFVQLDILDLNTQSCLQRNKNLLWAFKDLQNQKKDFVTERLKVLKEYSVENEGSDGVEKKENKRSVKKEMVRTDTTRADGYNSGNGRGYTYDGKIEEMGKGEGHISKRSIGTWLGVIGNMLYSTFLGGLSEIQIRRLNEHVKETGKEVEVMAKKLEGLRSSQVLFEEKTVGIIREVSKAWLASYTALECRMDMSLSILDGKMNFQAYTQLIDNILYPALSGRNQVLLTSKMIDITTLDDIVKAHPVFATSEFGKNPALLYSTSYMSLVGVNAELTMAHLVLEFPVLHIKARYPLFELKQVGLHLKKEVCLYFGIPGNVAEIEGKLREVDISNCNRHHSFFLCPDHVLSYIPACYQQEKFSCTQYSKKCLGSFEYIRTDTGVLFRSNAREDIYFKNKDGKIREISPSKFDTAYIEWDDASMIQVENTTLWSPGVDVASITVSSFGTVINFTESDMTAGEITEVANRLVKQYGDNLYKLMDTSYAGLELQTAMKKDNGWNFCLIYVLLSVVYLTLGITLWIRVLRDRWYGLLRKISQFFLPAVENNGLEQMDFEMENMVPVKMGRRYEGRRSSA